LLLIGPVVAILRGVTTWLIIRQRDRGVTRRTLLWKGAAYGALGAVSPIFAGLAVTGTFALTRLTLDVLSLLESFVFFSPVMILGGLLGWATALLLAPRNPRA